MALGAGDLARSKMYVVVAKYEYNSERWRNYVGVGGSATNLNSGSTGYQLHLRAGTEFGIIRYATPKLQVNLTQGLQLEGMYGVGSSPGTQHPYVNVSANLDSVTRAGVAYKPTPRFQVHSNLELRTTVGTADWGKATGVWAEGTGAGIGGSLATLRPHVNQVNGNVGAEYKITDTLTGIADLKYQGSNVGQSLGGIAGIKIQAPKGVEIMVFTGYSTTKLPGYMTQHSLLVGPNGAMFGAGLQTQSGIAFTGSVQGIGSDAPPFVQGGLSIPLGAPPKKYKPVPAF